MANDKDKNTITELDLDMELDAIEDLPDFLTPPSGAYVLLQLSHEKKDIGEHPAMEFKFKIEQILEITGDLDEDEKPPEIGAEFSMAFMLDNKFGQGSLKEYLMPIAKHAGTTKAGDTMSAADGMSIIAVISRKYNKKHEKNFSKFKKIAVHT